MPTVICPLSRVPLRERCNVTLQVDTSGRRSQHSRHEKPMKPVVEDAKAGSGRTTPVKTRRSTEWRDSCMGEIIPGMFVAFHDDLDRAAKITLEGEQATHVISISASNTPGRALEYSSTYDDSSNIRALHLTIPHLTEHSHFASKRLSLSAYQLQIARDFLSLALPYTPDSTPNAWTASSALILISTPFDRPVDAVCVVAGYLGYTSGENVYDVFTGMDDIEGLNDAWKGKVCDADVEKVQLVVDELDHVYHIVS